MAAVPRAVVLPAPSESFRQAAQTSDHRQLLAGFWRHVTDGDFEDGHLAAFERALEHFTVDRMVEGTIALYERLLAGRPVTT